MNKLINSLRKAGINISSRMESIFSKCIDDYMDQMEDAMQEEIPELLDGQVLDEDLTDNLGKNGIYTGTKQRSCMMGIDVDLPLKAAIRKKYFGL